MVGSMFSVWVTLVSGAGGFVDTKQNNKVELFGPSLTCIHHASLLLCPAPTYFSRLRRFLSAKTERSFQVFASVAPQAKSRTGVATGVFTGTRALQSNRFLPYYAVWCGLRPFPCLLLILSLLIAVSAGDIAAPSRQPNLAVPLLCV